MQQPQSGIVLPAISLARTFLTTAINHDPYLIFFYSLVLKRIVFISYNTFVLKFSSDIVQLLYHSLNPNF